MKQMILRQSFIKGLVAGLGEETDKNVKCHARLKSYYIDGLEDEPTDAMKKGLFFEQRLWGNTEGRGWIELPKKKGGAMTVEEERIRFHAENFMRKIKPEHSMDLKAPMEKLFVELEEVPGSPHKGRYVVQVSLDLRSSFKDTSFEGERERKGGKFENAIIDFKITESIWGIFGDFAWGRPEAMNHFQAYIYKWAYKAVYGEDIPFYYLVMDLSPETNYKFIRVMPPNGWRKQVVQAIKNAIHLIEGYEADGNRWPRRPSTKNCAGCPLRKSCPDARSGVHVQVVYPPH